MTRFMSNRIDVEGSGRGQVSVIIMDIFWRDWGKSQNCSVRITWLHLLNMKHSNLRSTIYRGLNIYILNKNAYICHSEPRNETSEPTASISRSLQPFSHSVHVKVGSDNLVMTFAVTSGLVWFMQDKEDWRGSHISGMSSPPAMGLLSAALVW
jgi:hypothetical protein